MLLIDTTIVQVAPPGIATSLHAYVPLCVIAVVLVVAYLAPDRAATGRRIDLAGVATFTVAATALMYVLIHTRVRSGTPGVRKLSALPRAWGPRACGRSLLWRILHIPIYIC